MFRYKYMTFAVLFAIFAFVINCSSFSHKINGYHSTLYPNGNRYVGDWKNSKWNGKGALYYKDGSKYEGNFKDSYFDGFGTFFIRMATAI